VNLLNKLPGVPAPEVPESVSQEGASSACRAPVSSRKGMEVRILGNSTFPCRMTRWMSKNNSIS
jgi:hypothetical protein